MALTGNETLQVLGQDLSGSPAATTTLTTTGAIAALASIEYSGQTITNISTVGAGTLTAAAMAGGVINRTGPVAAFTDTTATAAQLYSQTGSNTSVTFYTAIKNTTAFAETLAGGTGITLTGNTVIPANSVGYYLTTFTNATAAVVTHIFTVSRSDDNPVTITALNTVGAGTLTAGGIAGGATTRGGSQSATPFTDTTGTADAIIAANPDAYIGNSWYYSYKNNTDAAATLTGGTGVTVSGITVIPANGNVVYLVTYTAASTITMAAINAGGFTADAADATKLIAFKSSGATTGKTATIAAVNANDATFTLPAATDTLAGIAAAQTLTNKTLTAPVIGSTGAVFNGSSSGTTTVVASAAAGSTTQTLPAVTGTSASTSGTNLFIADLKRVTAQVDNTGTTLANVTGLSFTVVAGTYAFEAYLPVTCGGTGGVKLAFNYTTTALTSISATAYACTASALAVSSTTTTTTQTSIVSSATAFTSVLLKGTMVVATGGTVDLQFAENNANSTSSVLINGTMQFTRIA